MKKINVTIWNKFRHEQKNKNLYPKGMHQAIADGICSDDLNIRFTTMDEPEPGTYGRSSQQYRCDDLVGASAFVMLGQIVFSVRCRMTRTLYLSLGGIGEVASC